eukprot:7244905-Karenia_brevis.AAC.1
MSMHSTTGSDTYRLQSGHDKYKHTSMRRERSHAAHRASPNPFTDSSEPQEETYTLPSLEPIGKIPEYAIKGATLERGHGKM